MAQMTASSRWILLRLKHWKTFSEHQQLVTLPTSFSHLILLITLPQVRFSVCFFVCMPLCVYLPVNCMPVCLHVCVSFYVSFVSLSLCLYVLAPLFLCLYVLVSVCLCVYMPLCLFLPVCFTVCMSKVMFIPLLNKVLSFS